MPAYTIFDKGGSREDFDELTDDALGADLIFFGELHNNPICHWLQLELTKYMFKESKENAYELILGAEMFETDDQIVIDEYFSKTISQSNFEKESKIWPNYKTDYKPIVEFCRDSGISFIATNVPRRYASLVGKKGFAVLDSLSDHAKTLLAPLPVHADLELPAYKKMVEDMGGSDHGVPCIREAQAIKDATMAHSILINLKKGAKFIHLNGAYHSDDFEGIVWFIRQANPDLKILTITTHEQDNIKNVDKDAVGKADYIILTPKSMTKTN
jgi:uncharacterized iron-regulated protein